MKTAEEKAFDFMVGIAPMVGYLTVGDYNAIADKVATLIKEQDRDTRIACSEAIELTVPQRAYSVEDNKWFEWIEQDKAIEARTNVRAC